MFKLGAAFLVLSIILGLQFGSAANVDWSIIEQIRLPRVILAIAVGMGLAVAGAVLQALFSNPLCEPYTLGISSGSALGAVIGMSLGMQLAVSGLAGSAFLGALVFAGLIHFASLRRAVDTLGLLLFGVMLGFLGSSLVALWMAVADERGLQAAFFWLLGDLSRARLDGSLVALGGVSVITTLLWFHWKSLDAFLLGEDQARSMGVPVRKIRRRLILLTSILVGLCVSAGGMIGFVGLIVPHLIRLGGQTLHYRLIPLCAIWGAGALVLADLLARVVAAPIEVPVGVVTALVGAPLFVFMLWRRGTV